MDYRAYLRSVSGRLEADDYQVETGVDIPGYRLDLYAFKDTTEMSVAASTHKQIACFFVEAPKVTVGVIGHFCNCALSYENERRGKILNVMSHQGVQPVRLLLPVVASSRIGKDGITFVKSYNPFSWQLYQHPVLVNLETGEVYHHTDLTLYGAAYVRILNRVVEEDIAPK